jgi:hypothetical protein
MVCAETEELPRPELIAESLDESWNWVPRKLRFVMDPVDLSTSKISPPPVSTR